MQILQIGLALMIGIHLLPMIAPVKAGLQAKLGANGYKGLFSVISLVGFALIIWGMIVASNVPVFEPPVWAKHLAFLLVPIALILLASANMKGRIRAKLRHPMMLGIFIWAGMHFVANGDLASFWLFGSFFVYALVSLIAGFFGASQVEFEVNPKHDFMAIIGGLVISLAFVFLHPVLFGVQLF
ncbi:MAG: NnrU family protein [Robiginitomaculum sp.]|nr:NnrU family protein [Robiginitomaculum sp.]